MTRTLSTLPLAAAGDIVSARQSARRLAELVGFDRQAQVRFATAVSEIARNAHGHAGGGKIEFFLDIDTEPALLTAVITDSGPGIVGLDEILGGHKNFPPGRGSGLVSARKLVDQFFIGSTAGGTTVRLSQRLARTQAAKLDLSRVDAASGSLPTRYADPLVALHDQDRELMESLDALRERQVEAARLNRELEETNRGVVALYSELDETAQQLRSVSEMKSRFLSHMSHEFRTPLNSILALSRLLSDRVDGELNAEQARQVEYIRRAAQGLLEMVNDLLDLAKVEAGKLEVRPTEFSVQSLFSALRGSLKPLLVNPAVQLAFEDPAGLPAVYADEQKVAQVLRNLISNALRFTDRGHVRVGARHNRETGRMIFTVEDTGIGIAPQWIEKIFEEFAQVDAALQRGGTGLGLPLSRRLAHLMGGDLVARSVLGEGSTFELFVPVRFGQAAGGDGSRRRKGTVRVLVVDDEEAFRYVIRHIAHDAGHEVLEAEDGEAGMRMATTWQPDLIVLDLEMPVMDGYDMLKALADSPLRATPVIVCTSHALNLAQKRSLAAAYAIVPKHAVSRDAITALIDAVLTHPKDA